MIDRTPTGPVRAGSIVTWQTPPYMAVSAIRHALTCAGLDPLRFAPDLSPDERVRRVAAIAARARAGAVARRVSTRRVQITDEFVNWGSAANPVLEYSKAVTVHWDDTQQAVVADDPNYNVASFDQAVHEDRTGGDMGQMLRDIIEDRGKDLITIRPGCYFIPKDDGGLLATLQAVASGCGVMLFGIGAMVGQNATEDASIANALVSFMDEQLTAFREASNKVTEDTRSNVRQRRMADVKRLRDKLNAYGDLLTHSAARIEREIDEAETILLGRLCHQEDILDHIAAG